MTIAIAVLAIVLILILVIWRSMAKATRPLSVQEASSALTSQLEHFARRHSLAAAGLTVVHPRSGLRASFGADTDPNRRVFHAASVGKLFAAVMIGRLVDEGRLAWDTKLTTILSPKLVQGLFEWNGIDRSDEVTIAMLLSHTSGAADYYGDKGRSGLSVGQILAMEPSRFWSVEELLAFSKNEQGAIGAPGERYHYSDTGFLLLGLVLEAIRGSPYHTLLRREIFAPLGMKDAYMPFREEAPAGSPPMRPALIDGVDVSNKSGLSADWAGGGVALSAADLVAFSEALNAGKLIRKETLGQMADFRWEFMRGIGYGYGLMELRPGKFFPLLEYLPKLRGHMGILGIQCFWDPDDGTIIVVSFGDDQAVADSVRILLAALGILKRILV